MKRIAKHIALFARWHYTMYTSLNPQLRNLILFPRLLLCSVVRRFLKLCSVMRPILCVSDSSYVYILDCILFFIFVCTVSLCTVFSFSIICGNPPLELLHAYGALATGLSGRQFHWMMGSKKSEHLLRCEWPCGGGGMESW